MAKERAEQLRRTFESLPDERRLTLQDVEMVQAVLGRNAALSYSTTDDRLTWMQAHGEPIVSVSDVRRVLESHPRSEDDDLSFGEAMAKGIGEGLAPVFGRLSDTLLLMQQEMVRNRLRVRALIEVLLESEPDLYDKFEVTLIESMKRDWAPLMDSLQSDTVADWNTNHASWLQADEQRSEQRIGTERAARSRARWNEFQEWVKNQTPETK